MSPKPQEIVSSSCEMANEKGYTNSAFEGEKAPGPMSPVKLEISKKDVEKPMMDFDDLLPLIGEFGKYQKILFILMIPFAFFVAFVYFSQIFITLVPEEHWCRVPELENLTVYERMQLSIPPSVNGVGFNKCSMYAVNYTDILNNNIKVADPSWPTTSCQHGWEFNFTDVPYETIATELGWVCENDALPTFAQSIFFVGAICGGLLFGWIADRFGRIPALTGCNLIGFVAGICTIFSNSFITFSLCRFFVGFAFDNCFTMMYILVLEYVGPKWRTFVANMSIAIFFTAAACALPWIALALADWRMLAVATSAPLILAIFTPWFVPESARWLVSQGKIEKAITILKKFEKINGKQIEPQIYNDFSDSCARMQAEEEENASYSILDLFKTPRLRKITILLILLFMAISLVFDGHVRNVGSLGLNVFITFSVASFTELPADTFLTLTLDRWGRRWLAFGSMALSGVFSFIAIATPVGIVSACFAMAGRFCVNISYNIGLQYAAELLPTVVRAQGVAFIHIMGYVASIVAPFIVYLGNITPELPFIVLGILGILGGILALFLPETMDHELPQTLQDGEQFGLGQKLWDIPCCMKTIEDEESIDVKPFKRAGSTRASLRASTRGEFNSNMLQRSVRSRQSVRSIAEESSRV